jgi:SAM-dependent methyltransferase
MSSSVLNVISNKTFDLLHPESISAASAIELLLRRWMECSLSLRRGTNRSIEIETAKIADVGFDDVKLDCINFDSIGDFLFLSTEDEGVPYFCNAEVRRREGKIGTVQRIVIAKPTVIYRAERRDRTRRDLDGRGDWVRLVKKSGTLTRARVVESSGDGIGVVLPPDQDLFPGEELRLEGRPGIEPACAVVRNRRLATEKPNWKRIGLSLRPLARGSRVPVESTAAVLDELGGVIEGKDRSIFSDEPRLVEFCDGESERIVGILDEYGTADGAPGILIPSAWGKTKETLAGLSATLLATFASIDCPVSVLRIDGIRKRGESHSDPECDHPRLGNLHYTFSQGASDLLAAARYLQNVRGVGPIVIVSFSVASVEARRAVALDSEGRISGWISVVGATDPQSLIRVISGGVDYLGGAERGILFGHQEIQGLLLDIDRTAKAALENKIAFLEDARRDFAGIQCPVTWISGSHDAWTDLRRVEDAISFGSTSQRRLLTSETGHQLKSSREAAEIFGLVASECARLTGCSERVQPVLAEPRSLRRRQAAERRRLRPSRELPDLRSFWRDYLVGRGQSLGMELVTGTTSYRTLMNDQIFHLDIQSGQTVVDLGSGVSTFTRALSELAAPLPRIRVIELDYIVEALRRGRRAIPDDSPLAVNSLVADLNLSSNSAIPLLDCCADRVIASLVINYVSNPARFLRQAWSILRPEGKMVLSVLRSDADTSRICVDGVMELRTGKSVESFGPSREREVDLALGGFINDAGRLLDLEEQGVFRFWDRLELEQCVRAAGFTEVEILSSFGDPSQAWLLSGNRPAQSEQGFVQR